MNGILRWILAGIVLILVLVVLRRVQSRAARRARADGLAAKILAEAVGTSNRQDLADILRFWEDLKPRRAEALKAHLAGHPRLEGVDFDDPAIRQKAYEGLVGISGGLSPEK